MPTFARRVGRYLDLEVQGVSYEVYFESAGNPDGIPLVLQHTAGSDGRQWRHQLEDERIGRHFHLLAYDLPYHAKSVPPAGVEWWKQEYRLTKSFLLDFMAAFVGELQLEDPVYMGSSIGGHLALDLALHRPGLFQAVIGLEAAIKSDPGNIDLLDHPEINNGYKSELMIGIT
ncbi:MAG: alpha/beta hydrolase, partial [Acidobacteria bacterium]|nr:alpha/beta hydrolase [Acidobacteriota bacterium]